MNGAVLRRVNHEGVLLEYRTDVVVPPRRPIAQDPLRMELVETEAELQAIAIIFDFMDNASDLARKRVARALNNVRRMLDRRRVALGMEPMAKGDF